MGKLTIEVEEGLDGVSTTKVNLDGKPVGILTNLSLFASDVVVTVNATFADLASNMPGARAMAKLSFATVSINVNHDAEVSPTLHWSLVDNRFVLFADGTEKAFVLDDKTHYLGFLVDNNPDSGPDVSSVDFHDCCRQLEDKVTTK